MKLWIGFEFDGVLVVIDPVTGDIGDPIQSTVDRIATILDDGLCNVKIFSAKASLPDKVAEIHHWLETHNIPKLEVTNVKDFGMIGLFDYRATTVLPNTGVTWYEYTGTERPNGHNAS